MLLQRMSHARKCMYLLMALAVVVIVVLVIKLHSVEQFRKADIGISLLTDGSRGLRVTTDTSRRNTLTDAAPKGHSHDRVDINGSREHQHRSIDPLALRKELDAEHKMAAAGQGERETVFHSLKNTSSMVVSSVIDDGNTTVAERSQYQQRQVDRFCEKYSMISQLALPSDRKAPVYRRLLLNNKAKTLFCNVPKAGCTHLKLMYFKAQGIIPSVTTNGKKLIELAASESLNGKRIDTETCNKYVRDYFKFVMYRHPLERLVSGYRNKVEQFPLKGLKDKEPHFNWLNKAIYNYTHPQEYKTWFQNEGLSEVAISFSDFIDAWFDKQKVYLNPHFMPIVDLCSPCEVRYHYYGNFEMYEQDARVLAEVIGADASSIRHGYYSAGQKPKTSSITKEYYDQLTQKQKIDVLKHLSQDIDLYYHLFPVHKDSHKSILNVTHDLFVP